MVDYILHQVSFDVLIFVPY